MNLIEDAIPDVNQELTTIRNRAENFLKVIDDVSNTLLTEWEKDCQIEMDDIGLVSIKTAKTHLKYLRYLQKAKSIRDKSRSMKDRVYNILSQYHSGKLVVDGKKKFGMSFDSVKQLDSYTIGHPFYMKTREVHDCSDTLCDMIEKIISMIERRTYHIKNAIEDRAYREGNN